MEANTITWLSLSLLFTLSLIYKLRKQSPRRCPPSPPSLPLIGHLHLLKQPFHRVLQDLSDKHGPILSLSIGSRPMVVISSPTAVRECFTKNDIAFANRPRLLSGKYMNYNYTGVAVASYGHHWRNMRRIATTELLSNHRLNAYLNIRVQELKLWVKNLYGETGESSDFVRLEMQSKLNELSFNTVMRMVSGKRYFGVDVEDVEEAREFREIMKELLHLSGASNPADFLPILRLFDYQGLEKRMVKASGRADLFLQNLIDCERERRASRWPEEKHGNKTMIQSLLSFQESQPQYYSDDIIKGHVLTMLAAGTDTTTGTIEWAMSLLLNHPTIMDKAWSEIRECVGESRLVEEGDVSSLKYVEAIIYETLRLFPVAPLLVPHESSEECRIEGFDIPKGTMLLVNAWAIHRDPQLWEDPTSFRPERFLNWEAAESHKWVPFGVGRRACPGVALAHRVVGLTLATLIQCFEWQRVGEEPIDLSEGTGITMPKAIPLVAMCRARSSMLHLLSPL
ncbi:isoflavone 3'-hydroxylase-like isoform X2 [Cucurbita moschata]|uniref:Isoflavone 3'-hydroxylase-like isoform X1 n=1 Tax=Cucurbita moschata TaxID=3662 RepID=A0A6J1F8L9_CUCMO|nr:isoflavone 3'-hydroxylase-like isoform X1 [Cucurbita moschata]XP_022936847.1 isoflavone 3'-hydroxylase-like isoform X2 [Cucurbita moschata]